MAIAIMAVIAATATAIEAINESRSAPEPVPEVMFGLEQPSTYPS